MKRLSSLLTVIGLTTLSANAGLPGPPREAKSVEEIFSYFATYGGYNGRMESARFNREQGEILVVWEFYWYSDPPWAYVTAYRYDKDHWHRIFQATLPILTEDISVEFRRTSDTIIIRDTNKEIKSFVIGG